ncbi:pilus assembly protein [Erwinia sp. CPCC 100877]|nr:pilus assembly protein [Erwinia sp. CPCC 100877]
MSILKTIAASLCLITASALAVNVGSVTTIIPDNVESISKEIKNESDTARIISVSVQRISSPMDEGVVIQPEAPDEILLTPTRMIMPANASDIVKFYYHGKKDDLERYYRITFVDEGITEDQSADVSKSGQGMTRAVVSTILVAQPRNKNIDFDYRDGKIINKGNAAFRVNAIGKCLKHRPENPRNQCVQNFYVMPEMTRDIKLIDVNDKDFHLGIWDLKHFIPVK